MTKTVYELSPVFTLNTVSLDDRVSATSITWDFQRNNGAPIVAWSGNTNYVWVSQVTIGGKIIDVKLDIAINNGRFNNTNNADCTSTGTNTTFTIPSYKGAIVAIEGHSMFPFTNTTIDGSTEYTGNGTASVSYTVTSSSETIDIVHLDGAYFKTITVTLPAYVAIPITSALYATYYNSALALTVPANLQAATVDGESGGALTLNWRYNEGDVIPAGTPVLLKATTANTYTLTEKIGDATAVPAGNLLYGSDTETTTTGGGAGAKYYALQDGANGIGFYWMATGGAAFTSGAHKAWLALPVAVGAPFFTLEGGTTGINQVNGEGLKAQGEYYNLAGQRVAQPTKGLYIVGGKKVIVK